MSQPQPEPTRRADADQAVVAFDAVSLRYGREPEVLKDVSFALAPGSFHFLTGASGAGKSSLLKLIYMAQRPTVGAVRLFGQDVGRMSRNSLPAFRRRIGVVFQEFHLLDHLTAFENAALPLRVSAQKPETYADDVRELLTWVGLGARVEAYPPTLSGGEKQRLAIARAVVNRPEILLADEPTGNVDHAMAIRILRLFVELNRMGATVVIATHDDDLVARSGMPALHLDKGRLERRGASPSPARSPEARPEASPAETPVQAPAGVGPDAAPAPEARP